MKKVKRRATAALLIAAMLIIGVAVYLVRLADDGGAWATYFSSSVAAGTITDRNGTVLYTSDGSEYAFAEDWATRTACFQLIGDVSGNVGTGAIGQFRDKLSGYNFITGMSSGQTLRLTVDASLNIKAYAALAGRNGAVIVMNYKTGEILCMVSAPSMDPANPGNNPADGTYLNKAVSAAFVPGSVFKLVTLTAAIENIDDLYDRQFWCGGSAVVGGATLNCTSAHGSQTIEQALANSCNCAFSELAQALGPELLAQYAEKLGLTAAHELDGITTAAGTFEKAEAGTIDLSWSGIGQYHDMVSPYAMLRLTAAVANGGLLMEPTLIGRGPLSGTTRLMAAETAGKVADMMDYNVEYAYGTWNFPGLSICAKTGTAEVGDGTSHSWFTGFLADEAHPYAFVVMIEHGGAGLANAGSVANTVLQAAVAENNG
ncbi:MAG TPA: penicillin-binding protein [Clostridiales bacterium]|nr:penicillin-binding protein [Clostridiales bacterium]